MRGNPGLAEKTLRAHSEPLRPEDEGVEVHLNAEGLSRGRAARRLRITSKVF